MTDTPIADQTAEAVVLIPGQAADPAADPGTPGEAEIIETAEEYAQSLAELLAANGYGTEEVTETIFNVHDTDGNYLYTLTISRTPGY